MKILKKANGANIINPTREKAEKEIFNLASWMRIYGVHTPDTIELYEISDDTIEEDIDEALANSEPLAIVYGFTHDNMTDRDEELTPDEDADITTIISDNASDYLKNDYDERFRDFLSNF